MKCEVCDSAMVRLKTKYKCYKCKNIIIFEEEKDIIDQDDFIQNLS